MILLPSSVLVYVAIEPVNRGASARKRFSPRHDVTSRRATRTTQGSHSHTLKTLSVQQLPSDRSQY